MFELAFFSALKKDPDIQFVAVPKHKAGYLMDFEKGFFLFGFVKAHMKRYLHCICFQGFVAVTICLGFSLAIGIVRYVRVAGNRDESLLLINIMTTTQVLFTYCTICYFARQYFNALDDMARVLKDFDVRKCQLSSEADRPLLLGVIAYFFSGQEGNECGIERFNSFVKENLRAHGHSSWLQSLAVLNYTAIVIAGNTSFTAYWSLSWDAFAGGVALAEQKTSIAEYMSYPYAFLPAMFWIIFVGTPCGGFVFYMLLKLAWVIECKWRVFPWYVVWPVFIVVLIFFPLHGWIAVQFILEPIRALVSSEIWFYPSVFSWWLTLFTAERPAGLGWLRGKLDPIIVHTPVWSRVLLALWMVLISILTYFVYESGKLRRYRLRAWHRVKRLCKGED